EHVSGLPLKFHRSLFQIAFYGAPMSEIWRRSESHLIAGAPARILSPADALLHVCGHAFHSAGRKSLRWVSDAWFIIKRQRDLDWNLLFDTAKRTQLALPISVTLGYLAEKLDAPVPPVFLERFFTAASNATATERELALLGARSVPGGAPWALFRTANSWRERALIFQWLVFPSSVYLALAEKTSLYRPFVLGYVYRLLQLVTARLCAKFSWFRWIKWRIDRVFPRLNFRAP